MKKATQPSNDDFQASLETLFPKYIESEGCIGHPTKAFKLNGYRFMSGGYRVDYSSFLAENCETLFVCSDEDAIDCMKYLAKKLENCVGIYECTEDRYEELCRGVRPILQEK